MNLATQTKNFLSSFRLSAEGWGEEPDKEMRGSFWVCPRESASAAEARSSAIGAYFAGSSHHARGACEVSPKWRNRFGRSTIETPVSKSENPRRQKYAPRGARRKGEWANRALRARDGGSEKYISGNFLEGRIFWRGNTKNRNPLWMCLPHPPLRAQVIPSLAVLKKYYKTAGTAPAKCKTI